jgi:hypothetical protein
MSLFMFEILFWGIVLRHFYFVGISKASFYRVIWKTVDAINQCQQMAIEFPNTVEKVKEAAKGFQSISTQGCIWNCVSVLDGYHLQTQTPPRSQVDNVRSYFSGHYQTYGVNIQAACDHHCRFLFLAIAGPGVMGDRDAVKEVQLSDLIEALPGLYYYIGDCVYTPAEHLVPIYHEEKATTARNDDFNYYASQLRIRIEMAFGLMVKKWGILTRPLTVKVRNIKRLICAIARLHNFCINERLEDPVHPRCRYHPRDVELTPFAQSLRHKAAEIQFEDMEGAFEIGQSHNREQMARETEALKLTRPSCSDVRRGANRKARV